MRRQTNAIEKFLIPVAIPGGGGGGGAIAPPPPPPSYKYTLHGCLGDNTISTAVHQVVNYVHVRVF